MILRKDSDFIQNRNEYEYIKELKVQTDNPESIVITDSLGKACFLGNTNEERKVNWVNFFTGKAADNSVYVDYKSINGKFIEFDGLFTTAQTIKEDETVIFDFNKCAQLSDEYICIIFQMTQAPLLDAIRKCMQDGIMKSDYDSFEAFSRFRVNVDNQKAVLIAEKYKKSMQAEKVITKNFPKKEHCIAYSGLNHNAVVDGAVILLEKENLTDRLDTLAVACRALKDTDAAVELNDCVTVVGSRGYLYLEPFSVPDADMTNASIEIVANRQLPLEVYDKQCNSWILFESGIFGRLSNQDIRMRIGAETGDSVRNIYIKK